MFDANERVLDFARPDELVEFDLDCRSVPVLRVLDEEYHEKRHDRGSGIDDELPRVREIEDWSGDRPGDDDQRCRDERDGATGKLGGVVGDMAEQCAETILLPVRASTRCAGLCSSYPCLGHGADLAAVIRAKRP